MEQHWSSARRLANEDMLIPVLMRLDVKSIDPSQVGGLFKYVDSPILEAKKMPNPESVVVCGFVQTAIACIELLKKLAGWSSALL